MCRDRIFYVTTEYGQMTGFVLRPGILGCDIVGQVGKIFCRDRAFLGRDRRGQSLRFPCRDLTF